MIRIGKLRLVLMATALGVSCKDEVDSKDAEIKIQAWANKDFGPVRSVSCPDAAMTAGTSFDCTVTFEEGGSYQLTVAQRDNRGNSEWRWVKPIAGAEKLAEFVVGALKEQRPEANPTIDCGTGIKEVPADGITCQLDAEGQPSNIVIKLEGDSVVWDIE